MTWTAPQIDRHDPPTVAGERQSLESWLDYHRETLLFKCQGLTGEQLARRAVEPSSLSLLGLVRHMAEVERAWFRRRFAGQAELDQLYCSEQFPDGDFDLVEPDGAGTRPAPPRPCAGPARAGTAMTARPHAGRAARRSAPGT